MILGFEYFHPIEGECPNTFSSNGSDIIARARELLKNRSLKELKATMELINWMIAQSKSISVPLHNRFEEEAIKIDALVENESKQEEVIKNNLYERNDRTFTYLLKTYLAKYELPKDDEIPKILVSEIFATLALSLIDKAVDDEKYYQSWVMNDSIDSLHQYRILTHSAYWLIEAMDALSTAEAFEFADGIKLEIKEKLSKSNSKASRKRHAKTNIAILEIEKRYLTGKYKSMRNAVQIYCEENPEKVSHLASYNCIRTLTEGLSSHLKGQRRSMQNR